MKATVTPHRRVGIPKRIVHIWNKYVGPMRSGDHNDGIDRDIEEEQSEGRTIRTMISGVRKQTNLQSEDHSQISEVACVLSVKVSLAFPDRGT